MNYIKEVYKKLKSYIFKDENIFPEHKKHQMKIAEEYNDMKKAMRLNYFNAIFLGKTNSGKTYMLNNFVLPAIIDMYDVIVVFTRKNNVESYTDDIVKKLKFPKANLMFVVDHYLEQLNKLVILQENNIDKNSEKLAYKSNILIIWDDVLDSKMFDSDMFTRQFTNFRHLQISVILLSQITNKIINTRIKGNITFNFIFRINNKRQKDEVYDLIEQSIINDNDMNDIDNKNSKDEAKKLYRECVLKNKYGHIVISEDGTILHKTKKNELDNDDNSDDNSDNDDTDETDYKRISIIRFKVPTI